MEKEIKLLAQFGHSANVLRYYGYLGDARVLLLFASKATNQMWAKYNEAFRVLFKHQRRTLRYTKKFDKKFADFLLEHDRYKEYKIDEVKLLGEISYKGFLDFLDKIEDPHSMLIENVDFFKAVEYHIEILSQIYKTTENREIENQWLDKNGIKRFLEDSQSSWYKSSLKISSYRRRLGLSKYYFGDKENLNDGHIGILDVIVGFDDNCEILYRLDAYVDGIMVCSQDLWINEVDSDKLNSKFKDSVRKVDMKFGYQELKSGFQNLFQKVKNIFKNASRYVCNIESNRSELLELLDILMKPLSGKNSKLVGNIQSGTTFERSIKLKGKNIKFCYKRGSNLYFSKQQRLYST